jgi:uncharacterized membrane protein
MTCTLGLPQWMFTAALLLGSACSHSHDDGDHHHDEDDADVGTPTGATCPSEQTLTYENFGRQFLQTYCLRCHSASVQGADRQGAPDDHNFDDIMVIRGMAEHVDLHAGSGPAATNEAMPPSDPKPTLEERQKLSTWLVCGAP